MGDYLITGLSWSVYFIVQVVLEGEVCSRVRGCEACLLAGCYFLNDKGCVSDMTNGIVYVCPVRMCVCLPSVTILE